MTQALSSKEKPRPNCQPRGAHRPIGREVDGGKPMAWGMVRASGCSWGRINWIEGSRTQIKLRPDRRLGHSPITFVLKTRRSLEHLRHGPKPQRLQGVQPSRRPRSLWAVTET